MRRALTTSLVTLFLLVSAVAIDLAQGGPYAAQITAALTSLGLLNAGYTNGQCPVWNSTTSAFAPGACSGGGGSGTVTSVSVVSAHGLAGTVANPTTTPALTLSTSITGLLQGNGTSISAVTVGSGLTFSGGTLSATGGGGGFSWPTATPESSSFTAACGNFYAVTTSTSTITVTLPSAASSANCVIFVKKVDSGSGTVSIARAGSDLIDGLTSQTIVAQYAAFTLTSDDSSNWWIS